MINLVANYSGLDPLLAMIRSLTEALDLIEFEVTEEQVRIEQTAKALIVNDLELAKFVSTTALDQFEGKTRAMITLSATPTFRLPAFAVEI